MKEWKIGEIRQINGEWYQCVEGNGCENCAFKGRECYLEGDTDDPIGECCYDRRRDDKNVIFKKLEKVGEPFFVNIQGNNVLQQRYKFYEPMVTLEGYWYRIDGNFINIEIKQNKEDMEKNKLNLKSFDLQKAREGKPVCTRGGKKARIICFDANGEYPLIALITLDNDAEDIKRYTVGGRYYGSSESNSDLMMLPEKKEGWVNVYMEETNNNERLIEQVIYKTRKDAFDNACPRGYKATAKIEWEE